MFNLQKTYIHNDQILTQLSVKYENADYTGKRFLPDFRVAKETGKYRIFSRDGFFKGAPKKADGALTEEATLSYDEGTYSCYERAIKDIVTDRAMQYADAPVQPMMDATEFLTEKIVLSEELDTWILLTGSSGLYQASYRTVLTATTAWVDGTNPDPLADLSTGIKAISKAIGKRPNVFTMTTEVAEALAQDATIREIMKYHSTDGVVGKMGGLPPTLRGMTCILTDALYNASDEGLTASYSYVLSDNAVMAFVDPRNPLTLGRNIVSKPQKVARWRDEDREGWFIKVNKVYSPKITTLAAGYLFYNCKNS